MGTGFLLAACHQAGPTFTVDTAVDSVDANPGDGSCADVGGFCSLRAAVMEANALPGVDGIVLGDGVTYTLTIAGTDEDAAATGDLDITEQVVITGEGIIDANGIDRVIDVLATSGLVEIDGPDLTGGAASKGAALFLQGGASASLLRANVHANAALGVPFFWGAPIEVAAGTLYGWSATVHDNSGSVSGGIHVGASGSAHLQNLTITDNTGLPNGAGGLSTFGGDVSVSFSTITANSNGTADVMSAFEGPISFHSSIVESCFSATPTISSQGHNLAQFTSCGFDAAGDQQFTDPELGPLADNGGAVLTRHPLAGSPAVDAGPTAPCRTGLDARDLDRPVGTACDVGAVEVQD